MFSLGLYVHVYAVRFSGEVGFSTATRLVPVISCRAGQGIWGSALPPALFNITVLRYHIG